MLRNYWNITKEYSWEGFKILLALSLLGFVLSQVSLIDVKILLRQVSIIWILGAVISFAVGYFILATRYWDLLGKEIPFRDILNLVIVQAVTGNLIANVAGVVSYVGILRVKHNVAVSRSVVVFILIKFSDLIAIYLGLLISSYFLWQEVSPLHNSLLAIIFLITLGIFFFFIIILFRQQSAEILLRIIGKYNLIRFHYIDQATNFIQYLSSTTIINIFKILYLVLGYAMVYYFTLFMFFFCIVRSFSLSLGDWQILFILSFTQILILIPIQVFGGLGVIDLTTLYLYQIFGLTGSRAASAVVGFRIIFYLFNLLLILYLLVDLKGDFTKAFRSQPSNQEIVSDNQIVEDC